MQSQKPSWRKARSCPAAASRSSGSRSSTESSLEHLEDVRLEAEEAAVDPVLAARLLDEPAHQPSPLSSATPNCSSGRTTVIVAGAPWASCSASSACRSMSATPSA